MMANIIQALCWVSGRGEGYPSDFNATHWCRRSCCESRPTILFLHYSLYNHALDTDDGREQEPPSYLVPAPTGPAEASHSASFGAVSLVTRRDTRTGTTPVFKGGPIKFPANREQRVTFTCSDLRLRAEINSLLKAEVTLWSQMAGLSAQLYYVYSIFMSSTYSSLEVLSSGWSSLLSLEWLFIIAVLKSKGVEL